MVTTTLKGGMGNQMFQYAIARIIAEAKGYKLEISDPDNRKHLLLNQFPFACGVNGKEVPDNVMPVAHDLQHFDMNAVMNHNGRIFLHGYWQKHSYYTPHRDQIRKWFDFADLEYEKPEPTDLVMHVRLGDQKEIGVPTIEEYLALLAKVPHERLILVSDFPDDPFLQPIRELPKTVVKHNTNMMADFAMLKYAKRAIISQSTFAWWATFLGNPDKVYAPLTASGKLCLWKACPGVVDIDLIPLNNTYSIFKI